MLTSRTEANSSRVAYSSFFRGELFHFCVFAGFFVPVSRKLFGHSRLKAYPRTRADYPHTRLLLPRVATAASVRKPCYRLNVKYLAVLALAAFVPVGCRASDSGWTLVRSPHFQVYS